MTDKIIEFVESAFREMRSDFGILAEVVSFERWVQIELARRFLKAHDGWRVECDSGRSTRPDLLFSCRPEPRRVIELKLLWNNGKFLDTVRKVIDDAKKLEKLGTGERYVIVFPVFYRGEPDGAPAIYGDNYTPKRLKAKDENDCAFMNRLLGEAHEIVSAAGIDLREIDDGRWISGEWCGTMLEGEVK